MVSNKFLQDDGEDDAVISDEWAVSADISSELLIKLERDFLKAIVSNSKVVVKLL